MPAAFASGFGLGMLVAAGVGPISLLCIRSALARGFGPAWGVGAGAAVIDAVFAALGLAGAASLLALTGLRPALGLLGAALLVYLGLRQVANARRTGDGGEGDAVASLRGGFLAALAATALNPMTIASWAAVFAAASAAGVATSALHDGALVAGVGIGSLAWFTGLSFSVSRLHRRVGPRTMRVVDLVSGIGIAGFGGLLALRTLSNR